MTALCTNKRYADQQFGPKPTNRTPTPDQNYASPSSADGPTVPPAATMQADQTNDDYPPDDEARDPLPFPQATALPCRRIPRADVFIPGDPDEDIEDEVEEDLVIVWVRDDAVPRALPEGKRNADDAPQAPPPPAAEEEWGGIRAYALRKRLQDAIYGRVVEALGVRRRPAATIAAEAAVDSARASQMSAGQGRGRSPPRGRGRGGRGGRGGRQSGGQRHPPEWEATGERFAMKEMQWARINRLRGTMTEDPVSEVKAMQYFRRWHDDEMAAGGEGGADAMAVDAVGESPSEAAYRIMMETNVLVPVDVMDDRRYLYVAMPFCDNGDLFGMIQHNNEQETVFEEDKARQFTRDILHGLETLQRAKLAHRDLSLENLLVHQGRCIAIDMGQCVRVPRDSTGRRYLIRYAGVFGKTIYRPPEGNRIRDYDAYAVDIWTVAIVLHFLLTGIPPWDQATDTEQRFQVGCLHENLRGMLQNWGLFMSEGAYDLLQHSLRDDPRRRLSLAQVQRHPWMTGGGVEEAEPMDM